MDSPDYFWGMTHGDFHPGQLMYKSDGSADLVLMDWEFAGIYGNPAVDTVTYTWSKHYAAEIEPLEGDMLKAYWLSLVDGGVNPTEYPFAKF